MPVPQQLTQSLAENLLTLLCLDPVNGKLIAGLIKAELFSNELQQLVARRVLDYWHQHHRPPGKIHTPDLLADILEDRRHPQSRAIRDFLSSIVLLFDSNINTTYVLDQLQAFVRMQEFNRAVMETAQQLTSRQQLANNDIEQMWGKLLRTRHVTFTPGTRLGDYQKVLDWMERRSVEFSTGVKTLNDAGVVPARGAVMLYLAPKGSGKSWFLTDISKRGFRDGKKVSLLSTEMYEPLVLQRLYQSLFAVPKNSRVRLAPMSRLELDRRERFAGITEEEVEPEWALDSPIAADELASHLIPFGVKVDNLIIKHFPRGTLTMDQLRAYLDNLELVENFIPDMIVLDYFGLVKTDPRNKTESLTSAFHDFCSILSERNIAGVTAHQLTRKGAAAMVAGSTQVAGSWEMVGAADDVLVYSASEAERARGLGRLMVNHSRESEDHWTSLLTQNYPTGQYCLESIRLPPEYQEYLSRLGDQRREPEEESDDE